MTEKQTATNLAPGSVLSTFASWSSFVMWQYWTWLRRLCSLTTFARRR